MITKTSSFFLKVSAKKKLLCLLFITGLITAYYLWLPASFSANNFHLSEWTISLVEKINWQKDSSLISLNTLLLFIFLALATSIGLPRQIAALVAGINLGALAGLLIATLATTIGCVITLSVSRYLLSKKISQKYPEKLAKLSNFLDEQTFLKAIVIRILPLGSNFLTNIIAGVSKVSMRAYVSGSFVGFIPQMIIFSLAGSGIRLGAKNELIVSLVLLIVALILSAYLLKKHRDKLKTISKSSY